MTLKDAFLTLPDDLNNFRRGYTFFTGKKGYQQLNRIMKKSSKEYKIDNKLFMDIDNREVRVGDVVISAAYNEGYGVVKYKIIGETRTKWKVKAIKPDYITKSKIEKTNSLFIVESNEGL